ncbi:G-protein coupled receptor 20 [Trematomus bernacchii]|uniref:G-protein coupled receptor 20 n=1 Tax=Trematomus bernacchii TaxID=40690 RepID=UPI00146BE34E|nr:G-protein coupled receptor 20 [Trematomus bernacchii]
MADGNSVASAVFVLLNVSGNSNSTGSFQASQVIRWLTLSIGLPAIGLALYTLKNLSKGENKIPMHVVFLLVSDIVSFFGRPSVDEDSESNTVFSSNPTDFIFYFGIVTNVTLMLFIAQERHLLVAYPQCLLFCGNVRRSPVVTLLMWASPFGILALAVLKYSFWFAVSLLAPFPFLLFFAVDSFRAVMCSRSNPKTPERRRAVWGIGAILANYTFLYVPFILSVLLEALNFGETVKYLGLVSHMLLYLSPLVDPFIYIFMTKGFKEVMLALPCCHNRRENTSPTVETVAESVETRL